MPLMRSRLPSARPTALTDLPDDLLLHCLGFLGQADRLTSFGLVSKRFHTLSTQPQLLRRVTVHCGAGALATAVPWLARHAPHIEQLELRLREDGSASERIVSSVRGCFQALRSTQRLDHLSIRLSWGMPTFETGWLPPLPSLRRISLCNTLMMFSSAASDLPALQVLECLNIPWDAPEVVLPPTLTHIGLDGDRRSTLAEEYATLPNLQSLMLRYVHYEWDEMDALAEMRSLSRLSIQLSSLPTCLSALRTLRHLSLYEWSDADAPYAEMAVLLNDSLGHLTRLTALMLEGEGVNGVPPAVGGLPQLQRFFCWTEQADGAVLPAGPWLRSIRWLGVHPAVLCGSVPLLASAAQLELVGLAVTPAADLLESPGWDGFWQWAGQHPPLRRVHLDFDIQQLWDERLLHMEDVLADVAALLPQPTHLAITRRDSLNDRTFPNMFDE